MTPATATPDEILRRCRPGVVLSDDEVAMLKEVAALDTGGCTEWSCPYHGERNQARKILQRMRESGDVRAVAIDNAPLRSAEGGSKEE